MHIKQASAVEITVPADSESWRADRPPNISLLDTLPSFMSLSASQIASQDEFGVTEMWMRLAAGYMAQAVAEQYLVFNSQRLDVMQEAFAWGFDAANSAKEGSDEYLTNVMFWDEQAEGASPAWEKIREEHMRAVRIEPKEIAVSR